MSGKLAPIPVEDDRVYFQSTRKWGQVVAWPDGMANEILQMQRTHLRVKLLDVDGKPFGEPKYWPLSQTSITDEPGADTIRTFVTRVEYRKKKAKAKAEKVKKPLPDDDAEVPPDKPMAIEPLERED